MGTYTCHTWFSIFRKQTNTISQNVCLQSNCLQTQHNLTIKIYNNVMAYNWFMERLVTIRHGVPWPWLEPKLIIVKWPTRDTFISIFIQNTLKIHLIFAICIWPVLLRPPWCHSRASNSFLYVRISLYYALEYISHYTFEIIDTPMCSLLFELTII